MTPQDAVQLVQIIVLLFILREAVGLRRRAGLKIPRRRLLALLGFFGLLELTEWALGRK